MAITEADMRAELGTNPNNPQILRFYGTVGTQQLWYISGGTLYPGRVKFIATTASDNAATQAAAVATALLAGPA